MLGGRVYQQEGSLTEVGLSLDQKFFGAPTQMLFHSTHDLATMRREVAMEASLYPPLNQMSSGLVNSM